MISCSLFDYTNFHEYLLFCKLEFLFYLFMAKNSDMLGTVVAFCFA